MNLLIVDDEYFSAENIKNKLDWNNLGFDRVFCAYSIEQAQNIYVDHKIDILLCDIEMPKGSGLDLLEWIRLKKYETVCVFLTCHANFEFANRAIKLESSDYLLKPIESDVLLEAILKAISSHRQKEAAQINTLRANLWVRGDIQRSIQFWQYVIDQEVAYTEETIIKELKRLQLPSQIAHTYFSLLIIKYEQTAEPKWESGLFNYATQNIINELLTSISTTIFLKSDKNILFAPLPTNENWEIISKECYNALNTCCTILPGKFIFYLSHPCKITQLSSLYKKIFQAAFQNISQQNNLLFWKDELPSSPQVNTLPTELWFDLLMQRKTEEVQKQAVSYIHQITKKEKAFRFEFEAFYHDFSQILYIILDKKGASAHKLLAEFPDSDILQNACDNVSNLELWITTILTAFSELSATTNESGSIIEEVKIYIKNHLTEDINRNTLAQIVFLSPDYLSHLFRNKTGYSLTSFIAAERIKKAKELLLQNKLNIRDIAIASGFQNISYFSKQFKRATGVTPQEFRKGVTT